MSGFEWRWCDGDSMNQAQVPGASSSLVVGWQPRLVYVIPALNESAESVRMTDG
jgi:hypothetical protein